MKYTRSGNEPNKGRMAGDKFSFMGDVSNQNVYSISQQESSGRMASPLTNLDKETANLINWLAQQQGINPEMALKKAVATAAYIRDITANEGGRLLVQLKDGSVREILLK
ncbi:MAG: hypothetical protein ACK5C9_08605 [Pseudanabaena sp.]|jgi:hypothetical protein